MYGTKMAQTRTQPVKEGGKATPPHHTNINIMLVNRMVQAGTGMDVRLQGLEHGPASKTQCTQQCQQPTTL